MLFADDATIVYHHQLRFQKLMDIFSNSLDLFGLTIIQNKTKVMSQATPEPSNITVKDELEVIHQFQYIGSTISDTLSLYTEVNKCIGKDSPTFYKFPMRA
jgi:hypothetical protein